MKYDTVRLTADANVINMPILGASMSDPYLIKNVDGLGPPKMDIYMSNSKNQGGTYNGRKAQNRQLVMLVGINPDYSIGQTVESLRENLYKLLISDDDSMMFKLLYVGQVVAQATGYISNFEVVPFSKEPQVQITIDCTESYFEAPDLTVIPLPDVSPIVIPYGGNSPSGFFLRITCITPSNYWGIYDANSNVMAIDGYNFQAGEQFHVNTQAGERYVGSDSTGSLMPYLSMPFDWLRLTEGNNVFTPLVSGFLESAIFFTEKYWGV